MNVLLTGASGNFGHEFIDQADFNVVQLNRDDWDDLGAKFAGGIDVVIHAAGDLRTRAAASPVKLFDSNVLATARLLEAVQEYRIPRFAFLSSCAVYGEDMCTNEESKCSPTSINGIGKLLCEKMIAEFCTENKIKYEILRIFNMYGGRDHFSVFSHMKRALENGVPFTLNNRGIAQRDFIHVSDVVKVILSLLSRNVPYPHLNIGTGIATKLSALIELVGRRFPSLSIRHAQIEEAEYSRADITRLCGLVDGDYVRIEDYLMKDFMPDNA
jgi:UDP-glucose 4-epimerase